MRVSSLRAAVVLPLILLLAIPAFEAAASGLDFSTYLGGKDNDSVRDMAMDSNGNIYLVGTTEPPPEGGSLKGDFPTHTPFNLCTKPNRGGHDDRAGDLFISRFSSGGQRLSSTYFGGDKDDYACAIAVWNGSIFVAGHTGRASSDTESKNLPTKEGAYKENGSGVFVTKFDSPCQTMLASTLIEGTDVTDMALDQAGSPIVVGYWNGGNFTTTENAYQKKCKGGWDGIIVKLDPDLSRVVYASFLGGREDDEITGITTAPDGSFYVVGRTASPNFPVSQHSLQPNYPPQSTGNGFVVRFSSDCRFERSTLLGAWSIDGLKNNASNLESVATDSSGNVYVAGTYTRNGMDGGSQQSEAFAAKLTPRLGDLFYYKPLYGLTERDGWTNAHSIAVDENGSALVAGMTTFDDFPVVHQYQESRAGDRDLFLTKLSPGGEFITYSTYLGGAGNDAAPVVAIAPDGNAVVAGTTASTDFPVDSYPYQKEFKGGKDACISALTTAPSSNVNAANLGLLLSSPRLRSGDLLSMSISLGKDIDTAFDAYIGVSNNTTGQIASILLNGYVDDGLFPCARGMQGLKAPVLHSVWKNMAVTPSLAGSWTLYVVTTDPGRLPEGVGSVNDLKEFELLGKLPKYAQTIYTMDCVLSASRVH